MIEEKLEKIVGKRNVIKNVELKEYTSYKTGGRAKLLVLAKGRDKLEKVIGYLIKKETKFYLFGNFTNVLISDEGIDEIVIKALSDNNVKIDGEYIKADAGILLSKLANLACKAGLSGLEFASGIPGTLGAGICINAGAYEGAMEDVIYKTTYIDNKCEVISIDNKSHKFDYRNSIFNDNQKFIMEATLKLQKADKEIIKKKMKELNSKRKLKQPIDMPSAGSVFKRPTDHYTGKLIEDAKLKGFSIGGAKVSTKHAGFIINYNNASSQDIYDLIRYIQNKIKEKFNVELATEVKLIGKFKE